MHQTKHWPYFWRNLKRWKKRKNKWSFCRNANHFDNNIWGKTSKDDQSSKWRKKSARELAPLIPQPELETTHVWELLSKCHCHPSNKPGEERAKTVAGACGLPASNTEFLWPYLRINLHQCGEQCLQCIFKPPIPAIIINTPECQDKK